MADEREPEAAPQKQSAVRTKITSARQKWPWFDRVMRLNEHYGAVDGNLLAGGITYFGFLSFFPILALAFAVVGYISHVYPGANDNLTTAIQQVLPGIVSEGPAPGKISLEQIQGSAAAAGLLGLVGVLYAGLGWITALRQGLAAVFVEPAEEKPNFVKGKLTDLAMLAILGAVLIASVGVSGAVTGFAGQITEAVGLSGPVGGVLLWLLAIVVGIAASTVLFAVMYMFLAKSSLPRRALWGGAVLAALGFEALKALAVFILDSAGGSAFAPLALSITLLVWINYFSRLVVYGAAWACTSQRDAVAIVAAGT